MLEKQHYYSFIVSDLYHQYVSTQEEEDDDDEELDNLSIVSSKSHYDHAGRGGGDTVTWTIFPLSPVSHIMQVTWARGRVKLYSDLA